MLFLFLCCLGGLKKITIEDFTNLSVEMSRFTAYGKYVKFDHYYVFKTFFHSEVESIKAQINHTTEEKLTSMDPLVKL